ncbi:MAG: hypothetical protein ACLR0O_00155 [Staphylococcus aureus]
MEEINITHFYNKKENLSRIDEIVGKSFESASSIPLSVVSDPPSPLSLLSAAIGWGCN